MAFMGIVFSLLKHAKEYDMPNSIVTTNTLVGVENTPLPLVIAKRWNFPLRRVLDDDENFYAIRDWLNGILLTSHPKVIQFHYRHQDPYAKIPVKLFTFKKLRNKNLDLHFTTQTGLMDLLADARIRKPRSRLVDVRNFLAKNFTEYRHLNIAIDDQPQLVESQFQRAVVSALQKIISDADIVQYYKTPLGHKADVIVSHHNSQNETWLIECKVKSGGFYSAIGQLTCYRAELLQSMGGNTQLAIAMPIEAIDDYMRHIAVQVNIRLISLVGDICIDGITGELLKADDF